MSCSVCVCVCVPTPSLPVIYRIKGKLPWWFICSCPRAADADHPSSHVHVHHPVQWGSEAGQDTTSPLPGAHTKLHSPSIAGRHFLFTEGATSYHNLDTFRCLLGLYGWEGGTTIACRQTAEVGVCVAVAGDDNCNRPASIFFPGGGGID